MGLIYFFVYRLLNLRAPFLQVYPELAKDPFIVPNPDLAFARLAIEFISMIPIAIGTIGLLIY
jgi:hypothetical protein